MTHAMRKFSAAKCHGALVHGVVIAAQDGHVTPGVAFLMRRSQQLGDLGGFIPQARQAHDQRLLPFAAAADGLHQRHTVLILGIGLQELGGDAVGDLQNLPGVAVVDLENGRAPRGLDSHALEAEATRLALAIDVLGAVVQDQQAVGLGVHHLGDELEPFRLKVVPLVDHHGLVLPGRNLLPIHAANHKLHHLIKHAWALSG